MDNFTVSKVESFSPYVEDVPSEDGDWASVTSSAVLEMRDELTTEESGVAFVSESFSHDYQAITTLNFARMRSIQEEVGLLDHFEPEANGLVESDASQKYSVEAEIHSFARTVVKGAQNGLRLYNASVEAEYKEHESLDCYTIVVRWSSSE